MSQHLSTNIRPAVLVIGATGRIGKEVLHQLADHPSRPDIHAFCHDTTKLSDDEYDSCASVIEGSARHAIDIEEALYQTNSNWIVLCVGTGDDVTPNNIRTFASENIVRILQKRQFQHVRVLAVSMARSYHSIGKRNRVRYHCVLNDHKGQEIALEELGRRAIIVRSTLFDVNEKLKFDENSNTMNEQRWDSSSDSSTSLGSKESGDISSSSSSTSSCSSFSFGWPSPTRSNTKIFAKKSNKSVTSDDTQISTYEDGEHPSSRMTKRRDLATWIVEQICDVNSNANQRTYISYGIVNVTSIEAL